VSVAICTACGHEVAFGPLSPLPDPFVCPRCAHGKSVVHVEHEDDTVQLEELELDGVAVNATVKRF
jgi:hypothetical protein